MMRAANAALLTHVNQRAGRGTWTAIRLSASNGAWHAKEKASLHKVDAVDRVNRIIAGLAFIAGSLLGYAASAMAAFDGFSRAPSAQA